MSSRSPGNLHVILKFLAIFKFKTKARTSVNSTTLHIALERFFDLGH